MATEIKKVYSLDIQGVDSVNDLKKAIEQLNDKLKTLNDTSKEYKDTLIELTDYQTKLAEAMRGVTEATSGMTEMSEFLDDFTQGFVEGVNEAIESTDLFDESLLREATSVKELREQIKTLQDALVKLDSGSADYKRTVELLTEKNQKLQEVMAATKTQITAAAGSYNALTQELSALRKQWKATSDEAERARIGERMGEINKQLKELDASIGNYQRNVGNYANSMREVFTDPRKEIRALRLELAQLEEGSEEYNNTLMRMAELTTEQRKLTEQLRYSSSDLGDILGNLGGVARGVAGGFSAMNALMGLMGENDSDLQKAMLKTQQLMALVQGLSAMEGLKDRIKGLADGIKGFISRFGSVNKSTKDFAESTKAASTESERATGTLKAQAGAAEQLVTVMDSLNKEEMDSATVLADEISERQAKIAILKKEKEELELLLTQKTLYLESTREERDEINDKIRDKQIEIDKLENEIESRQKGIDQIKEESRERQLNSGEIDAETASLMKHIDALEKENQTTLDQIEYYKANIDTYSKLIKEVEKNADAKGSLNEKEKQFIDLLKTQQSEAEKGLKQSEEQLAKNKEELRTDQLKLTKKKELAAQQKKLSIEYSKLHKWQVLSIAENKLETAETRLLIKAEKADEAQKKGIANVYVTLAAMARVASFAVKGFKAALISSGIGALLVLFSSVITEAWNGLKNLIGGMHKTNEELGVLNAKTKELENELKEIQTIADDFGFSQFKRASMEISKLIEIMRSKQEELDYAIERGKKDTDELRDSWYEAQDAVNDALLSSENQIDKLIADIEKADRQKGMTQLEIDLEETNKKFEDAIELVRTFGEEGVWSADRVEAKINSLNNALAKQTQMLTEKANSATTSTTKTGKSEYEKQKEEADKLYKELVEANKREEQKLKEKYEKEKKLLEKFHKDTTLLTKQYYEELDKLLTERQKIEYDKWVEHLNSILNLQKNGSIEYMEMEIENLKKIFSADFGADIESPFEKLFNIQILDEVGSKAISITEDIAESMKMMGLDPTNIDDIQKMIDKWNLDKKAIEDAEKALKKYKSELKFTEYESEESAIDAYLDYRLQAIDTLSEEIASKSMKLFGKDTGFYTGLSPQDLQNEFEARYEIMEIEINKEIELWKSAMEDESLSAEDRNKAIQHYNQAMAKHNAMMVQKQIDANNLLIKSYQNVSDSLASISNSLTSILGSVSEAIMNNAEAQLNAGKITEEAYEEQFYKAKAFQIAQATIQTIAGAVGAFMGITKDTGGWGIAAAAIEAAAVLAAGFAQIAQIRATQPNTSGGNSGGGGGGATTFTLPSVMIDEPTYQQNLTNQSDIDALSNALGRNIGDQKVYVVESDIQNALDRSNKRRTEVTF